MEDRWLTYDTFAALLDTTFTARTGSGPGVPMQLVDAKDTGVPGGVAADGRTRTQFTALFRGPAEPALEQGTYPLAADAFPEQAIFLVPVRADAEHRYYEAVFA